jgi:hypothetical protein
MIVLFIHQCIAPLPSGGFPAGGTARSWIKTETSSFAIWLRRMMWAEHLEFWLDTGWSGTSGLRPARYLKGLIAILRLYVSQDNETLIGNHPAACFESAAGFGLV